MKAKGDLEKLKEGRNGSFANEISTKRRLTVLYESREIRVTDNNMKINRISIQFNSKYFSDGLSLPVLY